MKLKSRLLRITLITFAVLAFVGYFAFSTFLFSPVEKRFGYDVSALVPRDVDFFGARADLQELFDPFPNVKALEELAFNPAWDTFLASPEYAELSQSLQLEASLQQLDQSLAQLPISIDVPKVFGGKDLAVAGYFRGADLAQADWIVYGRVNWMGKMAVSLLSYPGLIGLQNQGIQVDKGSNWVGLSGGNLARPLYVTRIRDVVIAGTNSALVEKAHELEANASADSLYLSARYQDYIENANREAMRDELELFVDVRKLLENSGQKGPWPDPTSHFFTEAFLGRLFQIPACNELIGLLNFDNGATADLHGEFSSELIDTRQNRLYRERGFERDEMLGEAAQMAPSDTVFFAYVHAPIGDVLRQVYDSLEPAARANLDDFFGGIPEYKSTEGVIQALEGALRDRFAFIVRPNDYPPDPNGPPSDGQPVFAMTLVTWVSGSSEATDTLETLRDKIGLNGNKLGLQGRDGKIGFYQYEKDGFETREFWQPLVPGTGVITTINTSQYMLLSNTISMPSNVIKTGTVGGRNYPSLSDRSDFTALAFSSLPSANAVVWVNPGPGRETFLAQAEAWAAGNALNGVDWRTLRTQEEARVLASSFGGRSKGRLNADEVQELDAIVTRKLASMREDMKGERIPQLLAERRRTADYLAAMRSMLVMLRLDPKEFDLSLRAVVPLAPDTP